MTVYVKVKDDGSIVIREVEFEGAKAYELLGETMDEVEQLIPALLTQIKGE